MNWFSKKMTQAQKTELEKTQIQSQQYLSDACGRIVAEAEELIRAEFPQFEGRYSHYLTGEDQTTIKRMANIQMFLKTFQIYCKNNEAAAKENIHVVSIPFPGEEAVRNLELGSEKIKDPTVRQVLKHLFKGFKNQDLDRFPEELSEKILSSADRSAIVKNMVRNQQDEIAELHYNSEQLTQKIDRNLKSDIPKSNKQTISDTPLVHPSDIGPKKWSGPF